MLGGEPCVFLSILHGYNLRSRVNHVAPPLASPVAAAHSVIDPISGQSQEYNALRTGPDKTTWIKAFANDLGRLAQGVGTRMPKGTNTIVFIPRHAVPHGRDVTYGRLVASIRPTKDETHRVRTTVGGDRLSFSGPTSSQYSKFRTCSS